MDANKIRLSKKKNNNKINKNKNSDSLYLFLNGLEETQNITDKWSNQLILGNKRSYQIETVENGWILARTHQIKLEELFLGSELIRNKG